MIIEVKNVSKVYSVNSGWKKKKEIIAVDDVSFSIDEGECVGFIGPNGAGKSTMVKMLSGIIKPTSGEISVLGMDPIKDRKKLNYQTSVILGQKSQLSAHLSARDNFSLMASIYDIDKNDYIERFEYLTDEFDISDFVDTPIRHLSLGQRIRCEIIAALLHKPKVIFLDEPTIGLDTVAKQNLRSLLIKMNKTEKTAFLITSHDLGDIEKLCDRVIIIMRGKVVFDDVLFKLKSLSKTEEKELKIQFFGEADEELLSQYEIVKMDKYELILKLPNIAELPRVISQLQQQLQISDIEISSVPLEDIIASIYSKGGISSK